ncbi:MAG: DsrH/TusB family sulfur metabolism protein [Promethearchaeota archaeon]
MSVNTSIVYLYGFSTMFESKITNLVKIIEHQVKENMEIRLVFIHDGVIGTSQKSKVTQIMQKLLEFPITAYSMIPDLKARGIDPKSLPKQIQGITYEDLVDLLADTSKIVSWL